MVIEPVRQPHYKVYDKVIGTDSISYIITSNVITPSLKPSCDIVENTHLTRAQEIIFVMLSILTSQPQYRFIA